jgi:glutamine---fructose-6-phosphate transaminase (isomerizing)
METYGQLPAEVRDSHPYFMYHEIKSQPEAVARSLELVAAHGAGVVRVIAQARRVFVTGCGTSFHAAKVGAWLLRSFSLGKVDARAVQAYELVTYLPGLRPDDVVLAITHSGTTTMTVRAVERANRSGCESVVITGFPDSQAAKLAAYTLATGYDDEKSWAHTVSYTAALASMAAIANGLAESSERLDLGPLQETVADALELEELVHRTAANAIIAERYRPPGPIVMIGGGPNTVTAYEGVLKLLETSYVPAMAFELEQSLHGPLAAVTPETLVILIAPPGSSTRRAVELTRALGELDVIPLALVGSENAEAFDEAHRLVMPDLPEALSPIPYVVPLQLFSYFLAVGKGINPDLIHRDDERYRAARSRYE